MKKVIRVLFLATIVFGLTACGGTAENQDFTTQTAVNEQGVRGAFSGNTEQNTNHSTHVQNSNSNEIIAGTVQAIDGMNIAIVTTQHTALHDPGEGRFVSSGVAENEPQEITIRLTEQTTIEVNEIRTSATGGLSSDTRAGTLDDLTLQASVMAQGEWHGNEFVATSLIIM